MNCQQFNSQNIKSSFEYVDFWPKILLPRTQTAFCTKSNYSLIQTINNRFFDFGTMWIAQGSLKHAWDDNGQNWIRLDQIGSDWIRLDQFGFFYSGTTWIAQVPRTSLKHAWDDNGSQLGGMNFFPLLRKISLVRSTLPRHNQLE